MSELVKQVQIKWAVVPADDKIVLRWEAHIHPVGQVIVLDQIPFTPYEAADFAEKLTAAVENAAKGISSPAPTDNMVGDAAGGKVRLGGDGVSLILPHDRMVELMKGMEKCIAAMDEIEEARAGRSPVG